MLIILSKNIIKITMAKIDIQSKLLEWFDKNQRLLPWRKHYRPYEVWISEIMLQQTQMNTVLPYYERWMKLFPDVQALASSDPAKVLKAWEGLGYYSRARNLHATAQLIVQKYGGKFPEDFETILSFKGIGRYTAGAIASIAFNQHRPIVDGNILRVLSRVYAIQKPIDVEKNKPLFWELQEKLIPKGKARYFNQALMELGALICSPENPSCIICPIRKFCKTYQNGDPQNYPVRAQKQKSVKITAAALVLENKAQYLIRLRPLGEVMGGLWEFPEWKLAKNKILSPSLIKKRIMKLIQNDFGIQFPDLTSLGVIKRNYTYFSEQLCIFKLMATGPVAAVSRRILSPSFGGPPGRRDPLLRATRGLHWKSTWITSKDFSKYPFSSAHAKIVKIILETRRSR